MTGQRKLSRASRQQSRMRSADLGERGVGLGGARPGADAGREVMRVERQQHRGRLEAMQRRAGVGQFLPVLAVIVLVGLDPHAAAAARRRGSPGCRCARVLDPSSARRTGLSGKRRRRLARSARRSIVSSALVCTASSRRAGQRHRLVPGAVAGLAEPAQPLAPVVDPGQPVKLVIGATATAPPAARADRCARRIAATDSKGGWPPSRKLVSPGK